jgi:hypothetical protein
MSLFSYEGFKRFSVRGVQKHHKDMLTKIDRSFDDNFSSASFVLSRFRVFLSDVSSKALQKTFYKKIASKSFYKKTSRKIQSRIFLDFFLSRFWAFLGSR